jgi:hypothetical protein
VSCVGVIAGCADCAAELEYRERVHGPHVCGDMCEVNGKAKSESAEFHRLIHEPELCERCGHVMDDHRGSGSYGHKVCRSGYCTIVFCPACGDEGSSFGPVGCPSCGSIGHLPYPRRVSVMHRRYRLKKAAW